ncbi:SPOSA6832_00372 [Sporobolomyces salmonicolor]|uniref:SPOSA6832_00372-mRNA-1:cds n=1 Tax=Sporidiobolus salmonicolor TaxID=5005 RepID=A0A0D6EG17_SPOSA|nr:SPOSA6832_00372 [Sporobolomyces salmonicolor]
MQSLLLQRALARDPAAVLSASAPPTVTRPPSSGSSNATLAINENETPGPLGHDGNQAEKNAQVLREDKKDADAFLITFSPGERHNPQNWSYARRWVLTFMIAHIALLVGAAGSINSAAVDYAAADLHVTVEVALLDTALFLVGFGVAAPLMGPLSELGGRNPVYLVSILIFTLFEIGTACSTNIQTRVILRSVCHFCFPLRTRTDALRYSFFAGCAGASPLTNAGGSLAGTRSRTRPWWLDRAEIRLQVVRLGQRDLVGWPSSSLLRCEKTDSGLLDRGALVFFLTFFFMPETFAPTILKLKAAGPSGGQGRAAVAYARLSSELRKKTGDPRYTTALERLRQRVPFRKHFVEALQRPFAMLFLEPIVALFAFYMSVIYIVCFNFPLAFLTISTDVDYLRQILFGDLVAYSYIFAPYNLSPGLVGVCFIPIAVGLVICGAFIPFMTREYRKTTRRVEAEGGEVQPEERLKVAMIGSWLVPISLFWSAWTCYRSVSIWSVLVSQAVFGVGILTCFISSYQYIIDAYLSTAASGLSALTFVRYPISGGSVLFTGPMFSRLGSHWALTLLAFISLAASFIPWVFFLYGPKIRSWSRYAPSIAT